MTDYSCRRCRKIPMGIQKGRSRPYDYGLNVLGLGRDASWVVFTSVSPVRHFLPPLGASWQGSLVFPRF